MILEKVLEKIERRGWVKKVSSLLVLLVVLAGTATVAGENTLAERQVDYYKAKLALSKALLALTEQRAELVKRGDWAGIQALAPQAEALAYQSLAWEEEAKAIAIAEPAESNTLLWVAARLTTDECYVATYLFLHSPDSEALKACKEMAEATVAVLELAKRDLQRS